MARYRGFYISRSVGTEVPGRRNAAISRFRECEIAGHRYFDGSGVHVSRFRDVANPTVLTFRDPGISGMRDFENPMTLGCARCRDWGISRKEPEFYGSPVNVRALAASWDIECVSRGDSAFP